MKRVILLLTIISHFSFGQNNSPQYKSADKKTTQYTGVVPKAPVWSATDTTSGKSPVFKIETPRIKYKNAIVSTDTAKYKYLQAMSGDSTAWVLYKNFGGGGGSSTIDTTKVGRVEQGRGAVPASLSFDGVKWYMNDTSYIPKSGADNITGNLESNQLFFKLGLNNDYNSIEFAKGFYSQIKSTDSSSNISSYVQAISSSLGSVFLGVSNPNSSYSRSMFIDGSNSSIPNQSFNFDKGLAWYTGDYRTQMTSDNTIPDIGKVKQLISDSIAGSGGLTSVYSANSDILVDSSITGKRKLTLNKTLTSGYINIGDATNTAFPRALSGDATVSNTGVVSVSNATNAGTATALQTARTIGIATGDVTSSGSSFNGTANNTNALTVTKINGTSLAGLATGILKNTTSTGVPSIAVSGTDYEVPLTFSTGLTRATNTITNNLSTGISGGQTLIGSTSTTSGITYKTTTGVGTTGSDHIFVGGNNGNLEIARMLNNGNVGIGTTSPNTKLDVRGIISGGTNAGSGYGVNMDLSSSTISRDAVNFGFVNSAKNLNFQVASVIGTNDIFLQTDQVTGNGNFMIESFRGNSLMFSTYGSGGIGMTQPIIFAPNRTEVARIAPNLWEVVGSSGVHVTSPNAIGAGSGGVWAGYCNATPTATDDRLGIFLYGAKISGTTYNSAAVIGRASQAWTLGSAQGSYLIFETTANGASVRAERVRISDVGNVGIGITSPTTGRLQISAGSATVAGFQLTNQTAYTGGVAGSISLENTNEVTIVGNILAKRGTTANIGTSDNQALQLVTNNTSRLSISNAGVVSIGNATNIGGNLALTTAGNKLFVKSGTNASIGTATLVAGTVTVNTTAVTANSAIFVTILTKGTITLPVAYDAQTRVAGTSFTITSANVTDTSIVQWWIVEPN